MMGAGRLAQMLAMAKIAPQSFAEIARPGALEILQTTPITLKQIVRAAYHFLFVHFRRGVLPMLGLDALVLLMVSAEKQPRTILPGASLACCWLKTACFFPACAPWG